MSEALSGLIDDPWMRRATERRGYRFGRQMTWPNVALAYGRLFDRVVQSRYAGTAASGATALVRPA